MWTEAYALIQAAWSLVAGFIGAGGGFLLFKGLSEKWLDSKFNERLEAYKHAQQRELEQLKFEINKLMDRTIKLHQREFDTLPETWGRLTDAFSAVRPVALGFQEYPNVNKMTDSQLEEFLSESHLTNWQKNELKVATDKSRYYGDALAWESLRKAWTKSVDYGVYLQKNGIFIPQPIKAKFSELDKLLTGALIERRRGLEYRDDRLKFDKGLELHEKGAELMKSLEEEVQRRLWDHPTTDAATKL